MVPHSNTHGSRALNKPGPLSKTRNPRSREQVSNSNTHTDRSRKSIKLRDSDDSDSNGSDSNDSDSKQGSKNSNNSNKSPNSPNSNPNASTPTGVGGSQSSQSPGPPPPFPFMCCTIEDNDPRVHYDGYWTLNGTAFATTHQTVVSGSSVTLHFSGVGIAVIGVVPASNDTFPPPTAVYILDNQPVQTTLPFAAVNVPNQPLFASETVLSPGDHILFINVTDASAPFIIQNFFIPANVSTAKDMIGQLPPGATLASSASVSVPTAFASSTSTSTRSSATPSSQLNSPTSHTSYNPQRTIQILGSLLGTCILLVIAAGIIVVLYRRRMSAARNLGEDTKTERGRPETTYTWFTSTESIRRHDSSMFRFSPRSPRTPRSLLSRSDGRTSTVEALAPPPLPPKSSIFISGP